jgi:hypothetical protein
MGNSFFKKLDYGKSALLIPILVIIAGVIAVVLGDSFKGTILSLPLLMIFGFILAVIIFLKNWI